jgi:hypothetical protein
MDNPRYIAINKSVDSESFTTGSLLSSKIDKSSKFKSDLYSELS